ncbi:MAG TPA: oxalurate catabolism protein HpxZ [bacterium]|nr:oxalurate catabolism protein HpxZ [bacterium]
MKINDPEVVAEVTAAFERYETALMANDVATLNELFWDSPHTLRYGVWENLYGHAAIAAYRGSVPGGAPQRVNGRTEITTFGHDFAVVNREFERIGTGQAGRQSQTWVHLPEGWRIVAAHVSVKPPPVSA